MATDKMQVLCMRTRLQPNAGSKKDLKNCSKNSNKSTEQQWPHGVWELPTPLIVANRSEQRDEVREISAQPQQHPEDNGTEAYTAAHNIHAQFNAVKQANIRTSSLLRYNYHKAVPSNTDLTPATPNIDSSSGTEAQKLRIGSHELNQIYPTLLTQQKDLNKAQGASSKYLKYDRLLLWKRFVGSYSCLE
ncbi:hypothetical protein F511_26840 [Dorcoceras hygrometricum]|uniref:Uncharacterized protein n=1 Tax=Dorcoceras hygrometricum TaxID=472368 RepID=A0A2Z7BVY1_9LAMI|nr:hypothetical protein F511_26840 [Dorcoceras hygrometricum]